MVVRRSVVGVKLLFAALLVVALAAAGCSTPVQTIPFNCPPPPAPQCRPGTFSETLLDTTWHGPGTVQNHIVALPAGINTTANDEAITFVYSEGEEFAIVTSDRSDLASGDQQKSFVARYLGADRFGPMHRVGGELTKPFGTGVYCAADSKFYFSAKADNADPDDYDLYSATLRTTGDSVALENIRPLDRLNRQHQFESQPALDPTGLRIYFVSHRPGGYGGTDIWFSERTSISSEWSEPRPLPEPVNTACDEVSPYVQGRTLYFASNGHATVGGYDLFKSTVGPTGFSEPQNLGKPINTEFDETFPALSDTNFFWASNRPGFDGGRNLFTIVRGLIAGVPQQHVEYKPHTEKPSVPHMQKDTAVTIAVPPLLTTPVSVYVHVRRGENHRPAAGADLFVRMDSVEIYRGIVPASGNFLIKVKRENSYDFGAETEEAFFDVKHLDLHGFRDTSAQVDLNLPDTLVLRLNFPFDDYQHPYEFVIDENGQPSTMTWQQALDLTAHSAIRSLARLRELVLIGHTDSLGTDDYNARLGLHRAQFVASELIRRGVPANKIRVLSMGRSQPVRRQPGESVEKFRLRSRRVEFIKVFE